MIYDLHSHSNNSDGLLSASELVQRADSKGVNFLALTDHDSVQGIDEAKVAAKALNVSIIPGVEISARWRDYEIHIVGLNIDPQNPTLTKGLEKQQLARQSRFADMVAKLAAAGIEGTEEIVTSYANGEHVGRPTVAKFLVDKGYCEYKDVYAHLNRGGKFHCTPNWEYLCGVINWIHKAGGIAVIAHPDAYGFSPPAFKGILREFKEAGGQAIEVCYGACSKAAISRCAHYARENDLYGSAGSDFHRPAPGIELGRLKKIPRSVKPVWDLFELG